MLFYCNPRCLTPAISEHDVDRGQHLPLGYMVGQDVAVKTTIVRFPVSSGHRCTVDPESRRSRAEVENRLREADSSIRLGER